MSKTALIIGASSGIGRGLADILISKGYNLIATARRIGLLNEIRAQNPEKVHVQQMDVDAIRQLPRQLDVLAGIFNSIDLIVYCSGIGTFNESLDTDIELHTVQTNIRGFTVVASWAMNYFQKRNAGHLVAITSVGGLRGSDTAPAYNASKAYQMIYLEGLCKKMTKNKRPVYTTDVRAGLVDTDMAKGDGLFWLAPVPKTAQQIYSAIVRKKKVVYVTKRWELIAILLRWLPGRLYLKL